MDFVTYGFLAIIALVSGIIALFADQLGRKLGKKRLRLGRLRPKHTAALGVFTSGVMISVVTILLGYGVSSDVRQWIREGRRAIGELQIARAETHQTQLTNTRLEKANDVFRKENSGLVLNIDDARKTRERLQGQIGKFQAQLSEYRKDLGGLKQQLSLEARLLSGTNARLASAKELVKGAERSYKQLQTSYRELQADIHTQYAEDYRLRSENDKQDKANQALLAANTALTASAKDLSDRNRLAEDELQSKTKTLSGLQFDLSRMEAEIKEAGLQLQVLSDQSKMLDQSVVSSRTRPIIFAQNEELARISVPKELSKADARSRLTSLILSAQLAAEAHGAHSSTASVPSAGIFAHEDPVTHRTIEPDEILDGAASRLASNPSEQVVIARSTLNAFRGEPVSLDIVAYPNPLVYHLGQVIAETHIDGDLNEEVIYDHIKDFLRVNVRERAQKDHLIPYGNDEFGLVDDGQLLRIVKNVKQMGRPVRVQAIATQDTHAGDPLRLDFRIR